MKKNNNFKQNKKIYLVIIIILFVILFVGNAIYKGEEQELSDNKNVNINTLNNIQHDVSNSNKDNQIPEYSGSQVITLNNNNVTFSKEEK